MVTEIIRELTAINDANTVMSNEVLTWAKWVEAQRSQTAMLNSLKENRDFDAIKKSRSHTYLTQIKIQNVPALHQ